MPYANGLGWLLGRLLQERTDPTVRPWREVGRVEIEPATDRTNSAPSIPRTIDDLIPVKAEQLQYAARNRLSPPLATQTDFFQ